MMMRYHVGLGVGHAYAHGQSDGLQNSGLLAKDPNEDAIVVVDDEEVVIEPEEVGDLGVQENLDNQDDEDTDAHESDEELLARVEMYGR
jgi:hypothetical protein